MKRFFLSLLLILSIFSLVGCKKDDQFVDSNNTNENDESIKNPSLTDSTTEGSGSNVESNDNSEKLTPDYVTPNLDYNESSVASPSTQVEETVEDVYDSVVSINVTGTGFTSSGSGVLFAVDEELGFSYIVTCFHVIEDGKQIEIVLTNGEKYTALVVAGYADEDLAVLSIEKTNLTYASIYNDSDNLKLGSQVVCIGNPLGTLPGSVSAGYLSYVNREIFINQYQSMELLQTDVAINSGNSGGGLFNTSGALIGIVNAKYADESIEGLGFAIPSNTVKDVVSNFFATARYDQANGEWDEGYYAGDWELGFSITSDYYITSSGIKMVVFVNGVSSNSSAFGSADLVVNDIIESINIDYADESKTDTSIAFNNANDILSYLYKADLKIGDKLVIKVTRNNSYQSIYLTISQFIYRV